MVEEKKKSQLSQLPKEPIPPPLSEKELKSDPYSALKEPQLTGSEWIQDLSYSVIMKNKDFIKMEEGVSVAEFQSHFEKTLPELEYKVLYIAFICLLENFRNVNRLLKT